MGAYRPPTANRADSVAIDMNQIALHWPTARTTDRADTGLPASSRLAGLDITRALALVGMFMVHFGPEDGAGIMGRVYALPHGRASILFALVAGVGMAQLSAAPERRFDARLRLFWFAILLLPLGLALQNLDHPVAVILQHYAVFFVLGLCVLDVPRPWLLRLAVAMTLAGPILYLAGRMTLPDVLDRNSVSISDVPWTILTGLLITGPYPLLTWSAPILWGLWIGRCDLRARHVQNWLVISGVLAALAATATSEVLVAIFGAPASSEDWRNILVTVAHSQMPLWIVSSVGSGTAVLGMALVMGTAWERPLRPLIALGQLSLSIYVAHLVAIHFAREMLVSDRVDQASAVVIVFSVCSCLFAFAWRAHLRRGPVELLTHLPLASRS